MKKRQTNKCKKCDSYEKAGHNYCRICGYHLTNGFTQYTKIAEGYSTDELFCGYCGDSRNNCKCTTVKLQDNE